MSYFTRLCALAIACIAAIMSSGMPLAGENVAQNAISHPALPDTPKCPPKHRLVSLSNRSDWKDSEIWAWDKICIGEIANMQDWLKDRGISNPQCPPMQDPSHPVPELRSRFIKTILAYKPFSSLVTHEGVLIECAFFPERLDVSEIRTDHRLWLDKSKFSQGMHAVGFRTSSELSFSGSHFSESLVLDRGVIDGTVWLDRVTFNVPQPDGSTVSLTCGRATPAPCAVQIQGAAIGQDFSLTGSTLNGHLNAGGARIDGDLNLRSGTYRAVYLTGTNISGDLNTCIDPYNCKDGSILDHVSLDGAVVDGSVVLNGAEIRAGGIGSDAAVSLDLRAAHIKTRLELINARLWHGFAGTGMRVNGNAFLRGINVAGTVTLVGASIGGSLDLRGTQFDHTVDFSNATIKNTLLLHAPGSPYAPPVWGEGASLSLLNTQVDSLQDWGSNEHRFIYGSLQGRLDLRNFTYKQFGLVDPSIVAVSEIRQTGGLTGRERVDHWLSLQRDYNTRAMPQQFDQLARTLERNGYLDEARVVRVESRNQTLSANDTDFSEKTLLFFQKMFIGYGYQTWLSLIWLISLVLLGMWMGRFAKDLAQLSLVARAWYSLDAAIPLLELDERHKSLNIEGARAYFYSHRITGFVLASFLIAGLSGLTK